MKNLVKTIILFFFIGMVACEPNNTIAPIPPTDGAVIEPEVGGPDQPNQVFVDLSKATATAIPRSTWDLGFSNGAGFNVILNYSTYMVARATDQTDLAMVSSNLVTDDFKAAMVVAPEGNIDWIDNPDGDLNDTAIAPISADENENMVYVINRGQTENGEAFDERGFLKVKITRSGDNYLVTYGNIDDTSFKTLTVAKNDKYNFTFINFDNGEVLVEPEKTSWDIAFSTTSNYFFDHATNTTVPYRYKDVVITNRDNIKITAIEVTDVVNYNDYTKADVNSMDLENNRMAIGSSWRLFEFDTFSYQINPNIFYVVEDTEGNLYKLMFNRMYCIAADCAGERGYPEFTYELLK